MAGPMDIDDAPKKPTDFFNYLIERRWSFFVRLEEAELTNNQMSIVKLVKAARKKNLKAIKAAMNRIDGKLAAVVEVEEPKFYMDFPEAPTDGLKTGDASPLTASQEKEEAIPTTGLRNTLKALGRNKTGIITLLLELADEVERLALEDLYPPEPRDPFVKSVIMASLMDMGHDGNLAAIFEILDTIDGVVADKVKLLGDDVIISSPALVAPKGAFLGPDGVARIELPTQSRVFGNAIAAKKGLEITYGRTDDGEDL